MILIPVRLRFVLTAVLALTTALPLAAQRPRGGEGPEGDSASGGARSPLAGLKFRELGPATTSGRISDIAIHPGDKATWYIGAASGGIWKTTNAGTTWSSIFDSQASYAIGALAIAPSDPRTIWAGTGENNSQRSVGYG
ncbi:MAG: glycosyl hydrolase, partial [Gemmatimonadota bacterium]